MNKQAVVSRIKADGRNVFSWARLRHHNEYTVHAVLAGRIPAGSYGYKAITADLKADGYMTDEDES